MQEGFLPTGHYSGMKYKGMICHRCGVKVAHSSGRRKRMGHIELAELLHKTLPWGPCAQ